MAEKQRKITADDDGVAFIVKGDADTGAIRTVPDFWKDVRYASGLHDGHIKFKGCSLKHNADTSKNYWRIWKTTYDVNGEKIREQGPLLGAWDDRENLKWDK